MPGSFEGLSSGLPTASELGLSGIFAGNYSAAKGITEETISQINDLKGYAQSQATQIEDAVEALLASSQVDLPQIPNFGTAISLQGALAPLPSKPETREFCGGCHGKGTAEKDAPKIDLSTH